jgi:hypothetical protein
MSLKERRVVSSTRHVWGPWRLVAVLVGLGALMLGGWALIRTGFNTDHVFEPVRSVWGLPHTPALALGEVVFGLVMLRAAAGTIIGRPLMAALGALAVGIGGVVLVDAWPSDVRHWTAAQHRNGWVFVALGMIAFVSATMLPTVVVSRRIVEHTAPGHPADESASSAPGEQGHTPNASPAETHHWWDLRHRPHAHA